MRQKRHSAMRRADKGHFQQLFEHETVSDNEFRKVALRDEAAHEALNQARAVLDAACAQREYARDQSPMDGTVVARSRTAWRPAVPGAPILTLEAGMDCCLRLSWM